MPAPSRQQCRGIARSGLLAEFGWKHPGLALLPPPSRLRAQWVVVARMASVQVGAQSQVKDMALQSDPGKGAAGDLQSMTTSTVAL